MGKGGNEVIAAVQSLEVKMSCWGRSEGNVKLGISLPLKFCCSFAVSLSFCLIFVDLIASQNDGYYFDGSSYWIMYRLSLHLRFHIFVFLWFHLLMYSIFILDNVSVNTYVYVYKIKCYPFVFLVLFRKILTC